MTSALIVVDVQNDFMPADGALAVPNGTEVIEPINRLIAEFKNRNLLVVATQDFHPANHKSFASNNDGAEIMSVGELNGLEQVWWPDHCIQGTFGSELHKDLLPIEDVFQKGLDPEVDSYSGFFDNGKVHQTELNLFLRNCGVTCVYVVGLATDYCVKFTAEDAYHLGFETKLVLEASRGVGFPEGSIEKALNDLKDLGVEIIDTVDEVVSNL